ncbi:protein TESPA1 [Hyla sarda]|uniref:protein TESPA1 n=1 Tax=Hyla sarda TaxID=327740 RepID=UPI0024C3D340|nr:protein TESPA1 [Hyla sarda]XP_056418745.1 protein TESPA1 [Hyla sarda]
MTGTISSDRPLAWSRSRRANNIGDAEDSLALIMSMSEFTFQDEDEAFVEEGCTKKIIKKWLQDCRSCSEDSCEDVNSKVSYCKGNSLDDDFTLGAEATFLSNHHRNRISEVLDCHRTNLKTTSLGNSMASDTTTKTSSSISEVLTLCQADAETILYNLGFACEKNCSMYEIPSRFFLIPSKAEGINLSMYFKSLLHRIKRGDSSYIPADHGLLNDKLNPIHNSYSYIRTPEKKESNQGHWTELPLHEYMSSKRNLLSSFLLN